MKWQEALKLFCLSYSVAGHTQQSLLGTISPTHYLSQCSQLRGRAWPSGSGKKLLQGEGCCSHCHSILTKLTEIYLCKGEWLFESIALNALAKFWENVLADLQTGPSTQEDELWVEKVNKIGDTHTEVVDGVFEYLGCGRFPTSGGINNGSERALLVLAME